MKLKVIRSVYNMIKWIDPWIALLDEIDNKNVYLTPEWAMSWWKYFGTYHEMLFMVVLDDNIVVGICPLMVTKKRFYKEINYIGDPRSTYMDVIIKKDWEDEVINLCIDHLLSLEGLYLINLCGMKSLSKSLVAIQLELISRNLPFVVKSLECRYINITEDYDTYVKSRRKHRAIKLIPKYHKRLMEHGKVDLTQLHGDDIDIIFDIHDKRWQKKNDQNGFAKGNSKAFFKYLAKNSLFRDGEVYVYLLSFNNIPIGFEYGITYKEFFYSLRIAYDPDFAAFAPGKILHALLLKKVFDQKYEVFDFLTGAERHKVDWTDDYDYVDRIFFVHNLGLTKVIIKVIRWIEKIKNQLKKSKLLQRIKTHTIGKLRYYISKQYIKKVFKEIVDCVRDYGFPLYLRRVWYLFTSCFGIKPREHLYKLAQSVSASKSRDGMLYAKKAKLEDIWELSRLMHMSPQEITRRYYRRHYALVIHLGDAIIGYAWIASSTIRIDSKVCWEAMQGQQCIYNLFIQARFRSEKTYLDALLVIKNHLYQLNHKGIFVFSRSNEVPIRDYLTLLNFIKMRKGKAELVTSYDQMKST